MRMVETDLRKLIHDKLIMPVPPGWTAELDVEHFDETLGEPGGRELLRGRRSARGAQ